MSPTQGLEEKENQVNETGREEDTRVQCDPQLSWQTHLTHCMYPPKKTMLVGVMPRCRKDKASWVKYY